MTSVDPHGAFVDDIRRTYSSWMNVPEGTIRVRWYWVPDPPDGVVIPMGEYGSSDWDEYPQRNPPLGEDGVQRSPWRDWVDGSPPPWPVTVPLGLGVGFAAAARSVGRATQSPGIGLAFALSRSGYTRAVALAGYGASLALMLRVSSRAVAGVGGGSGLGACLSLRSSRRSVGGLGVGSGLTTQWVGRSQATPGLGTAQGSAASLPARALGVSGTGVGPGAVTRAVSRRQSAGGTSLSLAAAVSRKERTPGCAQSTRTPFAVSLIVAGITAGSCGDCANANGTFALTYQSGCLWQGSNFNLCTFTTQYRLDNFGGNVWAVTTNNGGLVWQVTLGGPWDGRSPLTLTRTSSGRCSTVPATVTVTPA